MRFEEIGKLPIKIADGNYSAKYPRSDEFKDKGIPFIRANNFKDHDIVDDDLLFISEKKHSELKKGHLMEGDILITTRGNIGNTAIVPTRHIDSNINAQIVLLRPDSSISNIYLRLILSSPEVVKQINALTTGTALKQLPVGNLKKVKLPIPPLEDQIRIASILSKAEALISQRKESLRLLDELLKSTFLEMFGDPVRNEKKFDRKKLKEVCIRITDGTHFSPPIIEEGFPYITAKHVRENKIDFWAKPWFISEKDHKEIYKRCDPKPGDVLYIKDGATTGYAAINKYDFEFSMLSSLALLRTDKSICNSEYLCSWLNNPIVKKKILEGMSGGAIQRLTLTKINELPINLPPLKLQTQFAHIVEKTEALKAHYQTSLQELENLYGSLSQRAFKGELAMAAEATGR